MRKKRKAPRLAAGELELLEVLWREKSVTIAEAHAAMGRPIGYTTVQTRLNRLVDKGVATKSAERPARYQAAIAPDEVSRNDLDVLVRRVSGGRIVPLVAHLVKETSLSADEILELKRLIREAEQRNAGRLSEEGTTR